VGFVQRAGETMQDAADSCGAPDFFDEREAAAKRYGFRIATFCAVDRPDDHPLRPKDYVPHDAFWTKRGYTKRPDIVAKFEWRDLNEAVATDKPMTFWLRELDR